MERTGGNVETLDAIIPNIRALTGVLSTAGSQGAEYARILGQMNNAAGETDAAFASMSDTMEFKLKKAQNSIENMGLAITQKLLPGLGQAADAVTVLVTASDKLDGAVRGVEAGLRASAGSWEEYASGVLGAAVAAGKISQSQADAFLSGKKLDAGMGAARDVTNEVTAATGALSRENFGLVRSNEAVISSLNNLGSASRTVVPYSTGPIEQKGTIDWSQSKPGFNPEWDKQKAITQEVGVEWSPIKTDKQLKEDLKIQAKDTKMLGEYYGGLTDKAISYTAAERDGRVKRKVKQG